MVGEKIADRAISAPNHNAGPTKAKRRKTSESGAGPNRNDPRQQSRVVGSAIAETYRPKLRAGQHGAQHPSSFFMDLHSLG